ncbi:HD domain-containing protein [Mycolicibacterium komossense]|uniref:HD domain-containing protein n=1 Tax=Mycolicibacterium komossense TaxID=1779 RepID=A0ABT3CEY8_9MYCO|nr:HD domain-containing protein [Mycolicibacterium komossense]MCV7228053.1 HD domain-containing protein [Mycolicibacterium komossense]
MTLTNPVPSQKETLTDDGGLVTLPGTPLAVAALALVQGAETQAIANHSVRSFLFARLLAPHVGLVSGEDFDEELLYLSCVLHDVGLSPLAKRDTRFEVDGADRAAEFLSGQGLEAKKVDAVWQAIALHNTAVIPERMGALTSLTYQGVAIDFGGVLGLPDSHLAAVPLQIGAVINDAYPRFDMATSVIDAVADHAAANPDNAPRYTPPGEVLRERREFGATFAEKLIADGGSRWGN